MHGVERAIYFNLLQDFMSNPNNQMPEVIFVDSDLVFVDTVEGDVCLTPYILKSTHDDLKKVVQECLECLKLVDFAHVDYRSKFNNAILSAEKVVGKE